MAKTSWWKSPFSGLFGRSSREDALAGYVIREHKQGRSIEDIMDDPYLKNRSTPEQRRRLLDRPDIIEAVGEHMSEAP